MSNLIYTFHEWYKKTWYSNHYPYFFLNCILSFSITSTSPFFCWHFKVCYKRQSQVVLESRLWWLKMEITMKTICLSNGFIQSFRITKSLFMTLWPFKASLKEVIRLLFTSLFQSLKGFVEHLTGDGLMWNATEWNFSENLLLLIDFEWLFPCYQQQHQVNCLFSKVWICIRSAA